MKRQDGFTLVEAIFIVIILAIIGALGYLAYTNIIAPQSKTAETSSVASSGSSAPVKVESKKDLDTASSALDNVSVDDTDSSQLDSATGSF